MATTVIQAFKDFLAQTVNLDPEQTIKAKNSRDWLVGQIHTFPEKAANFPRMYKEYDIFYGSFSRSTKKRPLDDIDLMICLSADSCFYTDYGDRIEITAPDTATRFISYVNEGTNILNSRKVINALIAQLAGIPQYKNAEIKRSQEAATLSLQSYDWVFDIVPCFITVADAMGRTFYVIPDGTGNWKKTDPRLDTKRVQQLNSAHKGHILNVIRAVKFWNQRPTMPTMGSYLLENMILDYYAAQTFVASEYVDIELVKVFKDISSRVYYSVNDPKNIQGDLNNLTNDEKKKISQRASDDYAKAVEARKFEGENNPRACINKWTEIFGTEFPKYEGI